MSNKSYANFAVAVFSAVIIFSTLVSAKTDKNFKIVLPSQTENFVIAPNKLIAGNDLMNSTKVEKVIPKGNWGGEHISLEVTERGANIEYDCAHGTINNKITLDQKNRFDVVGTYIEEHGGPVRQNEELNSYGVKISGQVKVKKMTLTVRLKDNNKLVGTYTLLHGQEPQLFKCR